MFKSLTLLLIVTVIIVSCHKDEDSGNGPFGENCRLVSISTPLDTKMVSFEYNDDRSIHKITCYDTITSEIEQYITYEYAANQVTRNQYDADNYLMYSQVYHLNTSGYADRMIRMYGSHSDTNYYAYDDAGQLLMSLGKASDIADDTLFYTNTDGKRMLIWAREKPLIIDSVMYEYYDFEIP